MGLEAGSSNASSVILLSLSESHLTCAHWSPTGERPLLTGITRESFSRPLPEVFYSESEFTSLINTSLHKVLEVIPFEGNQVQVVVPNSFVVYDFQDQVAELSLADTWDYIQWKHSQRWGALVEKRQLFGCPIGKSNAIQYLSCPSVLTTVLKLTIAEQGGRPVWMGPEATVFQPRLQRQYSAVVFIKGSVYELYRITESGFTYGTLRFSQGKLRLVTGVGDLNWIEKLLEKSEANSVDDRELPLLIVDPLSERRQQHWVSLNVQYLPTLEGVNTEEVSIPETIDQRTLNVITAAIETPPEEQLNMFGAVGLQEKVAPIPQPAEPQVKKEKKKAKKETAPKKEHRQTTLQILTALVFIGAIIFTIYLKTRSADKQVLPPAATPLPVGVVTDTIASPETEKDSVKIVETTPTTKDLPYTARLLTLRDLSYSITIAVQHLFENVDPQTITFLSISDQNLHVEMTGADTMGLDTTGIGSPFRHVLKTISCCGGTLHSYDFLIIMRTEPFADSIWTMTTIMSTLNSTFPDLGIVQLEPRTVGQWRQFPFILRVKGYTDLQPLLATLRTYGDYAFVHKIILRRDLQKTEPQTVLYLSVFQFISPSA